MSKIRELDLSWNQLTSLRDDLIVLRKHSPTLNKLDLRNNPWIKVGTTLFGDISLFTASHSLHQDDYLFLRVIGRLKSLTNLNGTIVTETDAAAALRLVSGTRVSQVGRAVKCQWVTLFLELLVADAPRASLSLQQRSAELTQRRHGCSRDRGDEQAEARRQRSRVDDQGLIVVGVTFVKKSTSRRVFLGNAGHFFEPRRSVHRQAGRPGPTCQSSMGLAGP